MFFVFTLVFFFFLRHCRYRVPASRRGDGLRDQGHEQRDTDRIRAVPVYDAPRVPVQHVQSVPAARPSPAEPARGPVVARNQGAHRPGQQARVRRGVRAGRPQEDRAGPPGSRAVRRRHKHASAAHAVR